MILDKILRDKNEELKLARLRLPLARIRKLAREHTGTLDLAARLKSDKIQIIAEVKKASPSRGVICRNFDPLKIASIYSENGAAAISVLTESKYFQGSLDYLKDIRNSLGSSRPPLLRKDFIFDPYQVYESRVFGADAVLLIAAILNKDQLKGLLDLSHDMEMQCLVETHNERELESALNSEAKIIGINNRDLQTFKTDLSTTERLIELIPGDRIIVSESGIKNKTDMEKLKSWGVNAALIGEALVGSDDIALTLKELL
jgi:indole-3-glycerol phosphate synthase